MEIFELYCSDIKSKLNYFATWAPNMPLTLGDYGVFNPEKVFRRIGNITQDFSLDFTPSAPAAKTEFTHASKKVRMSQFELSAAERIAGFETGVDIKFAAERSFYASFAGCEGTHIADLQLLGERVLQQRETGRWEDDWVVVCEVMRSDKTVVYIAGANNAEVKLGVKASENPNIGEVGVNFSRLMSESVNTLIDGEAGLTPLFRVASVQKRLLSLKPPTFRPLAESADKPSKIAEEFYVFEELK